MLKIDKTYILNLYNRVDKWQRSSAELRSVGLSPTWYPAIDANAEHFKSLHPLPEGMKYYGELGCKLSHTGILKDARSKGYESILVFEDDVRLAKDFSFDPIEQLLPHNPSIVYLGASQVKWDSVKIFKLGAFEYYHPVDTLGTWAMYLTRSGIDKALKAYEASDKSADLSLSEAMGCDESAYVVYPHIAITDVSTSDVRPYKMDQDSLNKSCRWDASKYGRITDHGKYQ